MLYILVYILVYIHMYMSDFRKTYGLRIASMERTPPIFLLLLLLYTTGWSGAKAQFIGVETCNQPAILSSGVKIKAYCYIVQ